MAVSEVNSGSGNTIEPPRRAPSTDQAQRSEPPPPPPPPPPSAPAESQETQSSSTSPDGRRNLATV